MKLHVPLPPASLMIRISLLLTAYFIGGKLGLSMPYADSNITLFWPPSGIALAAVLVWGPSCWPGILLGSLLIYFSTDKFTLSTALAVALGNTLAPLVGASLLKKTIGTRNIFGRDRDVVIFILITASSMVLSATGGTLSLYASGLLANDLILHVWFGWWLGDMIGVMIFSLPLLAWTINKANPVPRPSRHRLEFILVTSSCIAMAWLVFGDALALGSLKLSLAFLVFPPLIWAGLRFNVTGVSLIALATTLLAIWGTAQHLGPFSLGHPQLDQLVLCIFVATVALTLYMMIGIQANWRQAEQSLRESESRLRMALAASNQGLYDLYVQTGKATVSPEYALMLGYDPQTFEENNARWRDRLHPEDRQSTLQIYQDYLNGLRGDFQAEFRQLTRQGNWKWVLALGKIVEWDNQGQPLRMLGTQIDISDRKAKEHALSQSEDALRRAQALARLGSWYLDLNSNVLTCSAEILQIFAIKEGTLLNFEYFLGYVAPEDREEVEHVRHLTLQGAPYNIEYRINVSGLIKWVKEQTKVTLDKSGKAIEVLGTVQDISERKFAEEAVKQAKYFLRTVIDATPDWIFVKDKQHRFVLVNQAFASSQGLNPAEMIGKPDTDFFPDYLCYGNPAQEIRGFHTDDEEAIAGKKVHNPADPATLADGQLRWFDTWKLPMGDANGKVIGVLAYARDITDRLNIESKYRTLIEQIPAVTYIASIIPSADTLYVSPQIESQLGFGVQEWIDDPQLWIKQIHPDDQEKIMADLSVSFMSGEPYHLEYRIFKKDGNIAWIRDDAVFLKDAAGKPILLQGVMFDITNQRQAEENLNSVIEELRISEKNQRELRTLAEREQNRLSALLSAMNMGILFEDNEQRVEYLNPAFLRMWGISQHDNLLNMSTKSLLGQSAKYLVQISQAAEYAADTLDFNEISKRSELELTDGRVFTQLSYPVNDVEGRTIGRLWIYEDITQEQQTARQLVYLAERDPLTGLYNRHRFQEELANLIATSSRNQSKFALLYFDLDDFKYINDTFGHQAGDTVLIRTAGEISSIVRHIEMFARLGGDEFAILSLIQPKDDISALPARIITAISSIPLRFCNKNIRLTGSVGIAIFPDHGETAKNLIAHADAAMYQAKNKGKNTWAVYDAAHVAYETIMPRMTWPNRITQALEQDLFEIHFQGVYETSRNTLTHLESLVRMRDSTKTGNLIMPALFLPVAEKNGQIVSIDRWVIKRSIELLSQNPEMPSVAINISGRTFDDPTIPHYIRNLLTEFGVEPARLILELTEMAAISDIQDAQRFIEAVKQAGCLVCLDDFGNGFSTFGYLKYLNVDIIKIDGLFIRDLPKYRDHQIFVKAMMEVTHGLGKTTVAKFVEDAATLRLVKNMGIDLAQGYYLERPQTYIATKWQKPGEQN